jgi:hypothetical protein
MNSGSKHIHFIDVKDWPYEKWLQWRKDHPGFGGSEIAAVCATYSDYLRQYIHEDPIKMHMKHIGEKVQEFTGNRFSRWGHFHEETIQYLYQFWDPANPGEEVMFQNEKAGKVVTDVFTPKIYVTNDKYPLLFYSPDGFIGRNFRGLGNLECKNTTAMEASSYPNMVNPSFILQVQQGLLLTERDYAAIVIHLDGNDLKEIIIKPDKEIQTFILESAEKFHDTISKCRAIKEQYHIDTYADKSMESLTPKQQEGVGMLMRLEPELTGNDNELEFIKELVTPPEEEVVDREGSQEEFELVMQRREHKKEIQVINNEINKIEAQLIRALGDQYNRMWFDDEQFKKDWAQYRAEKRGNKVFRVSKSLQ